MNKKKRILTLAILTGLLLTQTFTGCARKDGTNNTTISESGSVIAETDAAGNVISGGDAIQMAQDVEYTNKDTETEYNRDSAGLITFGDVTTASSGITVAGNTVTITAGGEYMVQGTCPDGQLVIDLAQKDSVHLIFAGLDLTCLDSAPVYVINATKVIITLADGTVNTLADTANHVFGTTTDPDTGSEVTDDEPDAALFSKEDLTINGTGALTVNGNYKYAIVCKDTLKLLGGTITANSVDNGIKGKDYVAIDGTDLTVSAQGDGIKATNTDDTSLGFIVIRSGNVTITSGEDGLQAETSLLISGGTLHITTAGGAAANAGKTESQGGFGGFGRSTSSVAASVSRKGLKAGVGITVSGGMITVDSYDDALHANDTIAISDGTFSLQSGDDGIHADKLLTIAGGNIEISKSYEGLEAAVIHLDGGHISLTASDDGINAAGGSSVSSQTGGFGGGMSSSGELYITGGYCYINASGDGLDSNTLIQMSGGTVIVSGPTYNGNGAIDYENTFVMTGGFLVATGSSGMAQQPGSSSTQYTAMVTLTSSQSAGSIVSIRSADGSDIVTIAPCKAYNNIVICSPALSSGQTYTVYTGGTCTGTVENGLYQGGSYTGGTSAGTFTIKSICTTLGSSGGMGGGMGGGFGGGFGGRK